MKQTIMKQTKNLYLSFTALCIMGCINSVAHAALTIAGNGKSTFSIVIPARAPQSVTQAAHELQNDIAKSTGAALPIIKDTANTSAPYISLGSTGQAKKANITDKDIAPDGFRIVTEGGNVYIIGLDTTVKPPRTRDDRLNSVFTPDPGAEGPQYTPQGGYSNGTANGVYSFLEKQLGVRWLMPGELGLVIPTKSTFRIPEINHTESPVFSMRDMSFIMDGKDTKDIIYDWTLHQKLGNSYGMHRRNMNHSWEDTVSKSLYATHPEWFALIDGKRVSPNGTAYKIETTNQQLIKHVANEAIAALKGDPQLRIFSISPNDGFQGWSQSPESKALYDEKAPLVGGLPSVTPLILKYYRDVANIVESEYPQGKLAGFLYSSYRYPPTSGDVDLPRNFIPILADDQNYFYGLYGENSQKNFEHIISTWHKGVHGDWFVYDEPNILYWYNESGVITPPATGILNFYFSRLTKYGIDGMTTSGSFVWAQTALKNYLLAKLLWNPQLDANEVMLDWLTHAYGPQAAPFMDKFYKKVDGWFSETWRHNYITASDMEAIYGGDHYPQLEQLFLQAKAQPMTEAQKRRFDLVEMNMVVLEWRLKKAGYLPQGYISKLQSDTAQIDRYFFDGGDTRRSEDGSFAMMPELWGSGMAKSRLMKVVLNGTPENTVEGDVQSLRLNEGFVQIYAAQSGKISLTVDSLNAGSAITAYSLFPGDNGKSVRRGICDAGDTITFEAKGGQLYLFNIGAYGQYQAKAKYTVTIPDAELTTGAIRGERLYLNGKSGAKTYIYASGEKMQTTQGSKGVTASN